MTKTPFKVKESYAHLSAKNILAGWLTDINSKYDSCSFGPITWRSNYGVFTELPIHKGDSLCFFENSKYVNYNHETKIYRLTHPENTEVLFIPDICIFHKGDLSIIIEVYYKSPVSVRKLRKIENFSNQINVFQINALDILNCTKINYNLKFECLQHWK